MSERRQALNALLRADLPSFIHKCFTTLEPGRGFHPNWHIDHIAWNLARVSAGEVTRLIINIPPRHLKSICVTVAYTAWAMGHDPSLRIIAVSYADELARKLAADFRQIVDSDWYRELFPAFRIKPKGARKTEVQTTLNGYRRAGSVGGSILGLGADLIIIDDPIKAQAALSKAERQKVKVFYDNTLFTRLNDKARGAIVLVMQRLHADDLVGHVLGKERWEVAAIPAIETEDRTYRIGPAPDDLFHRRSGTVILPEREDRTLLDQIRRTLGSMNFAAQYQQDPVPPDGNAIKRSWIRYYDTVPDDLDLVVASWDTASTLGEDSDFSVGTVWGLKAGDIYLIEVVRGKLEVPDLRRCIEQTSLRHHAQATLVEETDIGRALVQEMRRGRPVRPILTRPKFDKEARLLAQAPKFEAGQVLLPREAPWLAEYLGELLAFPNGTHDDQVDSTSQALHWLSSKIIVDQPPRRRTATRATRRYRDEEGDS